MAAPAAVGATPASCGFDAVEIRRFRGIREGALEGLADVNVLVGRNNSGKTTVVEAISRGHGAHDVLGRDPNDYWQKARRESARIPGETPAGGEGAPVVETPYNVVFHYGSRSLGARFQPAYGVFVEDIPSGDGSAELQRRGATVFRPQDLDDGQVESTLWPAIIASRRDKLLVTALNNIFDAKIEQLQLLPDGRFMLLLPERGLALDVFGDGMRAATRCLMVLAAMKDALLMLEEPESHQHPGSLQRFAHALCGLTRRQNVQLILTTHSAECLRAFAAASADAGSSFAAFHLKLGDGLLSVRRFDRATMETLTATGVDLRFLDLYA